MQNIYNLLQIPAPIAKVAQTGSKSARRRRQYFANRKARRDALNDMSDAQAHAVVKAGFRIPYRGFSLRTMPRIQPPVRKVKVVQPEPFVEPAPVAEAPAKAKKTNSNKVKAAPAKKPAKKVPAAKLEAKSTKPAKKAAAKKPAPKNLVAKKPAKPAAKKAAPKKAVAKAKPAPKTKAKAVTKNKVTKKAKK